MVGSDMMDSQRTRETRAFINFSNGSNQTTDNRVFFNKQLRAEFDVL